MKRLLLCLLLLAAPAFAQDAPQDSLSAFYDVVALGPTQEMAAMLEHDPSLATTKDAFGFQAIHMLDYEGFADKLKLLLANGADINAQNDEGIALIHILIDPEFLPVVLAAGADINLRDKAGETPLMLFVQEPEGQDMVAALLDAKADVALRDLKGRSALAIARETPDNDEIVRLLIAANAPE